MLPAMANCEPAFLRRVSMLMLLCRVGPVPFGRPTAPPPYGLGLKLTTSLRFGRLALFIMGLDVGDEPV